MKLRLLFLTYAYPPEIGGLAESSRRISEGLRERGHEVLVVAPATMDRIRRVDLGRVVRLGHHRWNSDHDLDQVLTEIRVRHAATPFDAAIGFFVYPPGFLATYIAAQLGIPCLVSARGNDIAKYIFSFPDKVDWTVRHCRHVACVSADLKDLIVASFGCDNRVTVLPNSTELPGSPPQFDAPPEFPPTVAMVGVLRWKKGWRLFLEALRLIGPGVRGKLIGDVVDSEKALLAEALAEHDAPLEVTGFLTEPEVEREMQSIDVFVSPSLSDGMPNTLLKAVKAGRPVVVSDISGHRALIKDDSHGIIVKVGDSVQLASGIERCLADRGRVNRAKVAYETLSREFCSAVEIARYESILCRVVYGDCDPSGGM
jgi:glycosyltransferase involved in cell wall biosynthesis